MADGRAVADRRNLTRLRLAAVECAAEDVRVGSTDDSHRAPEVGGGGLVGDILHLAGELGRRGSGRTAAR